MADAQYPPSEFDQASCFSRWTYRVINPLMATARHKPLQLEDLYHIPPGDHSQLLHARLADALHHHHHRLGRAVVATFWRVFALTFVLAVIETLCRPCGIFCLWHLLTWLQTPTAPLWEGLLWAGCMGLANLILVNVAHCMFFHVVKLGWNIQTAVTALLHKKVLTLRAAEVVHVTTGMLVNLVSNDVNRFNGAAQKMHATWIPFLEIAVVCTLLAWRVGLGAASAGVGTMLVFTPVQLAVGHCLYRVRTRTAQCTDERVKITAEILQGVACVKAFTWEAPLRRRLADIRAREQRVIATAHLLNASTSAIWFVAPVMGSLALFLTHWLQGQAFQLSDVYSVLALLYLLRRTVGSNSEVVKAMAEALSAVKRLQMVLDLGEARDGGVPFNAVLPPDALQEERTTPLLLQEATSSNHDSASFPDPPAWGPDAPLIRATAATFTWAATRDGPPVLRDLSFAVPRGSLTMVVGAVGAGKSSLLQAVLGELVLAAGEAAINPRAVVSYAAQQPWIRTASLRHNVTLEDLHPLAIQDDSRFWQTVKVCGLEADIAALPKGEDTEIGEKGVNLSGGQRARVAMARACYRAADVYLLDDPLSAVDPHVQHLLFHSCIRGLLRGKAVVLVTHQLQFLEFADQVLVLNADGTMLGCGPFHQFRDRLRDVIPELAATGPHAEGEAAAEGDSKKAAKERDGEGDGPDIILAEDRQIGKVAWGTYRLYARHGGLGLFVLTLASAPLAQAIVTGGDYYLRIWSTAADAQDVSHTIIFSCFVTAAVFASVAQPWLFFRFARRAATSLHTAMFEAVLGTPLWFFGANPSGRILNRFAKDLGQVDDGLPVVSFSTLQYVLFCFSCMLIMVVSVPWLLIPFCPILVLFLRSRVAYLTASREVMRVHAISSSAVLSAFSSSLGGLTSIRAAQLEDAVQRHFHGLLDDSSRGFFTYLLTIRWFAYRLDMQVAFLLICTTLLSVALRGHFDVGLLGFALMYGVSLPGLYQWAVRMSAEVENLMVSVERILGYCALPAEESTREDQSGDPMELQCIIPENWPQYGSLRVVGLSVRYREDLPLVLNNVSFEVQSGQKVGIVGRTGSGKSTLLLSLLQLTDIT
eukprot:EG_transcript_1411